MRRVRGRGPCVSATDMDAERASMQGTCAALMLALRACDPPLLLEAAVAPAGILAAEALNFATAWLAEDPSPTSCSHAASSVDVMSAVVRMVVAAENMLCMSTSSGLTGLCMELSRWSSNSSGSSSAPKRSSSISRVLSAAGVTVLGCLKPMPAAAVLLPLFSVALSSTLSQSHDVRRPPTDCWALHGETRRGRGAFAMSTLLRVGA